MDAGAVTTARTVMRLAHPVQRVTSTSKVRRKRVAQSTRESGAGGAVLAMHAAKRELASAVLEGKASAEAITSVERLELLRFGE